MATALISLGSNLGDRQATLDAAVKKLGQTAGIGQVVVSSYHATKPVGGPEAARSRLLPAGPKGPGATRSRWTKSSIGGSAS